MFLVRVVRGELTEHEVNVGRGKATFYVHATVGVVAEQEPACGNRNGRSALARGNSKFELQN